MNNLQLSVPVIFMIYNNPDTTQTVFEEIRKARPETLLVIADGPREDRTTDAERCAGVRAIIEQVDWNCKVIKNYSRVNLGCGRRVSSGLDWAFSLVDAAIILEHDCLPHPTFFRYCQELLERYRDDERIFTISGNNFQFGHRRTGYSYYFSRYVHIWGWATWRRVWAKYYDFYMKGWPEVRDSGWLIDIWGNLQAEPNYQREFQLIGGASACRYWEDAFERTFSGQLDTWDYQLLFASLVQNGLNILPTVNLVSNIGFNCNATHTQVANENANIPAYPMEFPLEHPPFVIRDACADEFTQANHFV